MTTLQQLMSFHLTLKHFEIILMIKGY